MAPIPWYTHVERTPKYGPGYVHHRHLQVHPRTEKSPHPGTYRHPFRLRSQSQTLHALPVKPGAHARPRPRFSRFSYHFSMTNSGNHIPEQRLRPVLNIRNVQIHPQPAAPGPRPPTPGRPSFPRTAGAAARRRWNKYNRLPQRLHGLPDSSIRAADSGVEHRCPLCQNNNGLKSAKRLIPHAKLRVNPPASFSPLQSAFEEPPPRVQGPSRNETSAPYPACKRRPRLADHAAFSAHVAGLTSRIFLIFRKIGCAV